MIPNWQFTVETEAQVFRMSVRLIWRRTFYFRGRFSSHFFNCVAEWKYWLGKRYYSSRLIYQACSPNMNKNLAAKSTQYRCNRVQHHRRKERCKYCQRHNGPEGWVRLTKVTYFSHITNSNTKFDQILSSEYWPSNNFKISTSANISIWTKLKIQEKTWLQNLAQDSTSIPLQNISSKILTKP